MKCMDDIDINVDEITNENKIPNFIGKFINLKVWANVYQLKSNTNKKISIDIKTHFNNYASFYSSLTDKIDDINRDEQIKWGSKTANDIFKEIEPDIQKLDKKIGDLYKKYLGNKFGLGSDY